METEIMADAQVSNAAFSFQTLSMFNLNLYLLAVGPRVGCLTPNLPMNALQWIKFWYTVPTNQRM
jgi:hypothetical protein